MLEIRIYTGKKDIYPYLSCTVSSFRRAEFQTIVTLMEKKFPKSQGYRIEAEDIELLKTVYAPKESTDEKEETAVPPKES